MCVCVCVQACIEDQEAFGFEQSKKTYTLEAFGEKAHKFKSFYFSQHPTVSFFNPPLTACWGSKGLINVGGVKRL